MLGIFGQTHEECVHGTGNLARVNRWLASSSVGRRQRDKTALEVVRKQIHADTVLSERVKWIGRLRDELVSFGTCINDISAIMKTKPDATVELLREPSMKVMVAYSTIMLLVDPEQPDHIELIKILKAYMDEFENHKHGDGLPLVPPVIDVARNVLKREWGRIKKGE